MPRAHARKGPPTSALHQDTLHQTDKMSDICERVTVQPGDSCSILTQKYNVSLLDLQTFNGGQQCSSSFPAISQVICVTSGTLPPTPVPFSDGSCSFYTVKANDTCTTITQNTTFSISVSQLQTFNNAVCGASFPVSGSSICLSKGTLALPGTISNKDRSPLVVPMLICGMLFVILIGILCFSGSGRRKADSK